MIVAPMQIVQNALVLDTFDELTKNGFKPALGVYRGRQLVIISENATGLIAKIRQLWRNLINGLLFRMRLLSTDETLLRRLEGDVAQYCYKMAGGGFQARLDQLRSEISNKERAVSTLQTSILGLEQGVAQRTDAKNKLEQEAHSLEGQVASVREEIARHTCNLELCHKAEDRVKELESQKASLQAAVKEIEKSYETLQPKKLEVKSLEQKISHLQAKIEALRASAEQHDFKQRCEDLLTIKSHLKQTVCRQKGQISELEQQLCQLRHDSSNSQCTVDQLREQVAHLKAEVHSIKQRSQTEIDCLKAQLCQARSNQRVSVGHH